MTYFLAILGALFWAMLWRADGADRETRIARVTIAAFLFATAFFLGSRLGG